MIYKTHFKDRPAVCVKSKALCITLLPCDGAKAASLIRLSDGKELLYVKPGDRYAVLSPDGDYVSSECSGFDDMFPTVDPYLPKNGPFASTEYPDHGEACRLSYSLDVTDDSVILRANSRLFPVKYEKRVFAASDGSLVLSYRIINDGDEPFDFLWAGHIMLRGEDGMTLISPFDDSVPVRMMFAPAGTDTGSLSLKGLSGFEPGTGAAYKFYYEQKMPKGRFGVSYADGSELIFETDETKLPYLAFWLNNGEFKDIYTLTPEPASVPYDSPERAAQGGIASFIDPHSDFSFDIKIKTTENNKYD